MISAEHRDALTGPIPSIRTPFLRDGSVDYPGLRRILDACLAAGGKTMLLTAGDSHFLALSDAEIEAVTRVTVEHVAGRALVVAADRHFDTRQAVDFARRCHEMDVDMLMCMPPDWAASCTPNTLAEHYTTVAEQIPVMIVSNIFIPRGEAFGLATVKATLERQGNVVALKDDMGGAFAQKLHRLVGNQWALIAGGQKRNHMLMHPFGCDGYLSTFLTFYPEISHRYWQAIAGDDLAAATAVIEQYDMPFFDRIMASPGGFDAALHGVMELVGLCGRWRRPPYYSLSDAELRQLQTDLRAAALLPGVN